MAIDPSRRFIPVNIAVLTVSDTRSLANDTLAFSPPLIITEAEVTEMLDRVARALDELTVQVRRERLATV